MRTVLYIEDSLDNVRLMESIFDEIKDTLLLSVCSAEQGIDQVKHNPPDMILMDINLPGMDGITALKLLKESVKTWDIPVIAVTASARPDDLEMGRIAGFNAYITKPIDISNLMQVIQKTFEAFEN
jgi:CheY-like chemotaxis protein